MTTTPHEPLDDPDITPSGDPDGTEPTIEPVVPGSDPDTAPHSEPPGEL